MYLVLWQGLIFRFHGMKLLKALFLLISSYSCTSLKQDRQTVLADNLIIGEWRLDSSSNRFFSYDRLIILEDSSLYLFSGSDGGSLIATGRWVAKDSIITGNRGSWKINFTDSNHLHARGDGEDNDNFYRRNNYGDFHDNLKEYLQQDSLRELMIGWWKLISNDTYVKLINNGKYYKDFTLNIRDNGDAIFYLDNKFDSTVDYSYRANTDGIDLMQGCVVSDCKASLDSKGRMKIILDHSTGDTLLLERLTHIK